MPVDGLRERLLVRYEQPWYTFTQNIQYLRYWWFILRKDRIISQLIKRWQIDAAPYVSGRLLACSNCFNTFSVRWVGSLGIRIVFVVTVAVQEIWRIERYRYQTDGLTSTSLNNLVLLFVIVDDLFVRYCDSLFGHYSLGSGQSCGIYWKCNLITLTNIYTSQILYSDEKSWCRL